MNPNEQFEGSQPQQNAPITETPFAYGQNYAQPFVPVENPLISKYQKLKDRRARTSFTVLFSLVILVVGFGTCFGGGSLWSIGLIALIIGLFGMAAGIAESINLTSDISRIEKLLAQGATEDTQTARDKFIKGASFVVLVLILAPLIGGGLCFGILAVMDGF